MPNSRFALHGTRPSLIHGLCAFFASNLRFMRLFQAALYTPLDSGDRESPKRRFSQKTADFRRFAPFPGNSSIWRAQETAENSRFSQETEENRRKPQIGPRHLSCVKLGPNHPLSSRFALHGLHAFDLRGQAMSFEPCLAETCALLYLKVMLSLAGQDSLGNSPPSSAYAPKLQREPEIREFRLNEANPWPCPSAEMCRGFCFRILKTPRRLWLFPGSVREFPRKTPGKSRANCWKKFPGSPNATNSRISGTRKGKPAGNLGSTLPGPCPHLPCGVFF